MSAGALAGLRILAGLLWLYNVSWKSPPDFGESSGSGLYGFTRDAVDHPVFPPYTWLVETVVLPNFTVFGWGVLVVESLLAVLLLSGAFVRPAALLGVGQSLAIALSVAQTPGEWPWAYWMMIGIHLVLLVTASSAALAVDAVRGASGSGAGAPAAAWLLGVWGVVVAAAGVLTLVLSVGEDPVASSGTNLGGPALSVSLGTYNLVGAAVLVVVAVLMLAAALLRRSALAGTAAVLAGLAALSVYVQLSRTEVWIGGNNTSAAFLLSAALVGVALAGPLEQARARTEDPRGG